MVDLLDDELKNITGLFKGTDYVFYEVYNPYNGKADGGWQYGHHWESCINQTWCATGYIGTMLYGVMGMKITENSISFLRVFRTVFITFRLRVLQLAAVRWIY